MRLGSLFSGIGGLELGLEASLGATTVWQVEIDTYARQVLERKWPKASRDVCDIRQAGAHNLEPVDVLVAGFPCQGISVAGKGRGLEDARSGLWFEALRIIREIRPPIVVLENVPAIRTRGLGVVLGGLASLGYDAEWGMLSASDVGAPHQRRRWWCIAYIPNAQRFSLRDIEQREEARRDDVPNCGQTVSSSHGEARSLAHAHFDRSGRGRQVSEEAGEVVANSPSVRGSVSIGGEESSEARTTTSSMEYSDSSGFKEQRFCLPTQEELGAIERSGTRASEPRVGRASHGFQGWSYEGEMISQSWECGLARTVQPRTVPHRVSRLKCLGNAVVPMWSFWIGIKTREVVDWLQ